MSKLAILAASAAAAFLLTSTPDRADAAVVYCKTVGVPKGCVMRPTAPVARVIYCTAPGVPLGCVARPVARGTARAVSVGVNRGGPVNRVGVR
jgi:hypothetical protein